MAIFNKKIRFQKFYKTEFQYKQLNNVEKHLLLVCAPKSGSTWLTRVIIKVLKWETIKLLPAFEHREQEIDLSPLLASKLETKIFSPHQHLRYSIHTEKILTELNSYIVLQVRDIYDTIISYKDHLDKESVKVPAAYMDDETWKSFSDNEKLSFVVDMVVPWYFNFYCGWVGSNLYKNGRIKLLTYEKMKGNMEDTIKEILDFIDEPIGEKKIVKAIDKVAKKNTRKNKGISGRGNNLPIELKEKVVRYSAYYPNVDFKPLGL